MTTNKDKTGDQLVASMRKSKTGAVARKNKSTPRSTPSDQAASSQAPATNTASTSETRPVRENGYSCGRRVWPD